MVNQVNQQPQTLNPLSGFLAGLRQHPQFAEASRESVNCPKHGEFEQITYQSGRKSLCPHCLKDREQEARAAEQAKAAEAEAQRRARDLQQRIGDAGVPPRFANKTAAAYAVFNPVQESILAQVKAYAAEFTRPQGHSGRNMLFVGNKGTGKTHLSAALINHVIKNCGGTARFCTVSELNRIVRESKSYDSPVKESEVIRAFGSYDLLVIDEVGVQSGTEAESRALFDVFNERYGNLKPTIMISNLRYDPANGVDELTPVLGDRVIDRMKEDGGKIFGFNWESYRGNGA